MPTYTGSAWHYSAQECRDNAKVSIKNLLSLYAEATDAEMQAGINWYPQARERAEEISSLYSLPLETVIKVAAALSPKCKWENNMDSAEWVIREFFSGCHIPDYSEYAEGKVYLQRTPNADPSKRVLAEDGRISAPPAGGLKSSVIKALWILQGIDCLSGPKVNDFYECILNWENYLGACIDSHAIQAWFGSLKGGTYGVPPTFYRIVRADYIKAAEKVGLSPLQFQAVLWLVKKRLSTSKRAPVKQGAIEFLVAMEE